MNDVEHRPEAIRARPPAFGDFVAAGLAAVAIGFVMLRVGSTRFLNPDGAGYLVLARGLGRLDGYVFADGSAASFRGPGYPLALVPATWFDNPATAGLAISRLLVVAGVIVVALVATQVSGRWWAGALAAAFAAVQPITYLGGARYLVPDAFGALFVVAALGLVDRYRVHLDVGSSADHRWGGRRLLWAAVVMLVAAVATKETMLVAVPALLAAWLIRRHRARWLTAACCVVVFGAVVGVFLTVDSGTAFGVGDIWSAMIRRLPAGYFRSDMRPVAVLVAAVIVYAVTRRPNDPLMPITSVAAAALAVHGYSSLLNYGARNAVLFVDLAAVLGAAMVVEGFDRLGGRLRAESVRSPSLRRVSSVGPAVMLVAVLAWPFVESSAAFRWQSSAERGGVDWADPLLVDVAAWLDDNADGPVSGTFFFLNSLALLDRDLDVHLIPMFRSALNVSDIDDLRPDSRVWWAARKPASVPDGARLLTLTRSVRDIAAVYEGPLLESLAADGARHLLISGNASQFPLGPTYEGGLLIPYLEAHPSFRLVYATDPAALPLWVAVYEIDGPLDPIPDPPLIVSSRAEEGLGPIEGATVLGRERYFAMLTETLARGSAAG